MQPSGPAEFGILGAAGFVAPRHLEAIVANSGRVIAACDTSDSVGVLDRHGLDIEFTTDVHAFAAALRRRSPESETTQRFAAICTPNHLHFEHCRLVLEAGADAICEKPLVLTVAELEQLRELEQRSGRRVYTVLQLRLHERLSALKLSLAASNVQKHDVVLTYVVGRGPWYHASWKGDRARSGGVATNIGIHLFDSLLWLFGPVERVEVHVADDKRMAGTLELELARVTWLVSVESTDAVAKGETRVTQREMLVDGERYEFSEGFADLHTRVYAAILAGQGLGIEDARPSIELTERLRSLPLSAPSGNVHPIVQSYATR